MSKSNTHIYNKTILAIAVLSLSACSTAPEREEFQIRHIGQGIITAADATADFSKRAWNRTTYLLGFSDGPTTNANGELLDEVDLALLEEDAAFPDQVSTQAVVVPQATPNRLVIPTVDEEDLLADLVVIDESKAIAQTEVSDDAQIRANGQVLADAELPSTGQILDETQLPSDAQVLDETQLAAAASSGAAAVEDLIHEVQEDQNLWTIAKQTTGDANNWHSIADVNNLAPNASVYPGQQLIIPGDLLETNYDTQVQNTSIAAAGDVTVVEELAAQPAANTDQSAITIVAQEQAEIIVQPESETVTASATESSATQSITAEGTDQAVLADASANSKGYKLKAGENLWDLAKRVTGDAMNWTLIAAQNNLTEDQAAKVYAGQTIYVPEELVQDYATAPAAPATETETETELTTVALPALDSTDGALETAKTVEQSINVESAETVATTVSEQTQEAIDTTSQLITNATSTSNNEQPLKIVEATFKSDKNLTDLTSGLTASAPTNEPAKDIEPIGVPVEVMVSGTYYPKAVYNDADFSSSLLMRVSPGTTLQVSRAFGTWFEVNTSKGRGFVHQRDIK